MIKRLLKKIIPPQCIDIYHATLSLVANMQYGFPSRKLIVIGVTGTDGKTTTCNFIQQILDGSGNSCGLLSTALFKIGNEISINHTKMTTINPFVAQKMMSRMITLGNTYVVVETSSHAISQKRNLGIAYDVVLMTNLSREHLDYHKNMGEYQATKKKLFTSLEKTFRKKDIAKVIVLNREDGTYDDYVKSKADQYIAYGYENGDVFVKDAEFKLHESVCRVRTPQGDVTVRIPMPGKVNVYNTLAAISACLGLGISVQEIQEGVKKLQPVPGRMQSIHISKKQDFSVFIDYAVTPHAFEKLYETLKHIPHHKIIAVFGACGDRDKGKRPLLGQLAFESADYVILTNEDNWSEKPEDIIAQIEKGMIDAGALKNKDYEIIVDRKEAIYKAIQKAQTGDIVVVSGKGNETGMAISTEEVIEWSDKKVIEEALKEHYGINDLGA